jgi:integrase
MPPQSHNTKVYPCEKDEQEKLVTAFTEESNGRLRLHYGWGCVLILETGLRAGVALALEWGDIDEEKRSLKVTKNMVRVDGKNLVQRTTKTESGRRTIPLNAMAPFVFATQTGRHRATGTCWPRWRRPARRQAWSTVACTR